MGTLNGVPGKDKFISEVEKLRRPGQNHKANICVVFCNETRNTGLVGAIVEQLDGTVQVTCIRLKDLIELQRENKIYVTNMRLAPEAAEIWTYDLRVVWMYLLYKHIKYPRLSSINAVMAHKIKDFTNDECIKNKIFR